MMTERTAPVACPDPVGAFLPYPAQAPVFRSGPFKGLRLAVKDIFDVEGFPTGFGQPTFLARSGLKALSAPLVQQHLAKGCSFVGKTHMVEMAYALTGRNIHFGTPLNPSHPDRLPGGSSSGSAAAVAAGLADVGLSTDTLGSIRAPASYCGLFGIRPTHGTLSLDGAAPLAPSFDTAGWLTRDLDTLEQLSRHLMPGFMKSNGPGKHDILIETGLLSLAEPETSRAFEQLAGRFDDLRWGSLLGQDFTDWPEIARIIQGFEAWEAHKAFVEGYSPQFGPGIRERFEAASKIRQGDYVDAKIQRQGILENLRRRVGSGTLLFFPTAPGPAPSVDATDDSLESHRQRLLKLMVPSSLAGLPQLSLPMLKVDGFSVGVSLMGPPNSEALLLRAAADLLRRFSFPIPS